MAPSAGVIKIPKVHPRNVIPRPAHMPCSVSKTYPPGSNRRSLLQLMGVYPFTFDEFVVFVRKAVKEFLNPSKLFALQDQRDLIKFMSACMKYPLMQQYEEGWPIEIYAKLYFPQYMSSWRGVKFEDESNATPLVNGIPMAFKDSPPCKNPRTPALENRKQSRKATKPQQNFPKKTQLVKSTVSKKKSKRSTVFVDIVSPPRHKVTTTESAGRSTVLDFLRSLDPPQEKLYPIFIDAGVINKKYLDALARNAAVRDAFIAKLERHTELKYIQSALVEEALTRMHRESEEKPSL